MLGVTTDILFPIQQQRDLVEMLKQTGTKDFYWSMLVYMETICDHVAQMI